MSILEPVPPIVRLGLRGTPHAGRVQSTSAPVRTVHQLTRRPHSPYLLRRSAATKAKGRYIDDDDDDEFEEEGVEAWTASAGFDGASTSTAHLKSKTPKRTKKANSGDEEVLSGGEDLAISDEGDDIDDDDDEDDGDDGSDDDAVSEEEEEKEEKPKSRAKKAPPKAKAAPAKSKAKAAPPAKAAPAKKTPARAKATPTRPAVTATVVERPSLTASPSLSSGGPSRRVGLSKSAKVRALSPVRIPATPSK